MAAVSIDGRALAAQLRGEVAAEAAELERRRGIRPRLDVVLVGADPASETYVRTKTKAAAETGITGRLHALPAATAQDELERLIRALNADQAVDGILVQLPLPPHLHGAAVPALVSPEKDVDGFHPLNLGRLASGSWPKGVARLLPCTPQGSILLLEQALAGERLQGRDALVIGRSAIVGKPLALMLLAADCTVTVAHSRTAELKEACLRAEIVVAAVGRPGLVRGDWLRPDAIVIDVGINRVQDPAGGKPRLVGDVAYDEAVARVRAITPVPGGVGPMTVACLLLNTVRAARARHELPG